MHRQGCGVIGVVTVAWLLVGGLGGPAPAAADGVFVGHATLTGGPLAVKRDEANSETGFGGLLHLAGRGAVGEMPAVSFGFDAEVGYGDGAILGRANVGGGATAFVGQSALTAMLGVGLATLPYASVDASLELSAGYYPRPTLMLWGALTHAEGLGDVDRDQLDLRFIVPPEVSTDLGLTIGARAALLDHDGTPTYLVMASLGLGMSGGF